MNRRALQYPANSFLFWGQLSAEPLHVDAHQLTVRRLGKEGRPAVVTDDVAVAYQFPLDRAGEEVHAVATSVAKFVRLGFTRASPAHPWPRAWTATGHSRV